MNIITRSFQLAFEPLLNRKPQNSSLHRSGVSGFARCLAAVKRRHQINRNIRELSNLSNHTLKDIGIERGNIPTLATELTDAHTAGDPVKIRSLPHPRSGCDTPLGEGAAA